LTGVESVGEKAITVTNGPHVFGIKGSRVQHRHDVQGNGKIPINGVELK
jgi:hypothetical protein